MHGHAPAAVCAQQMQGLTASVCFLNDQLMLQWFHQALQPYQLLVCVWACAVLSEH
jgi:hypothetical protein